MNKKIDEKIINSVKGPRGFDREKLKSINLDAVKGGEHFISSVMKSEVADKVIEGIQKFTEAPDIETVWILTAGILQRGASNSKASNSVFYNIGKSRLTAGDLIKIIKAIDRSATARQFARAIGDEVAEVAEVIGEEGDLASQMRLDIPNLTLTDAVWCSNFQTTNPKCPENVRKWLIKNYQSRFNK